MPLLRFLASQELSLALLSAEDSRAVVDVKDDKQAAVSRALHSLDRPERLVLSVEGPRVATFDVRLLEGK